MRSSFNNILKSVKKPVILKDEDLLPYWFDLNFDLKTGKDLLDFCLNKSKIPQEIFMKLAENGYDSTEFRIRVDDEIFSCNK